jgi:hypothetical protein
MPIMFPPQTGICVNCGQHWTVSFPTFDVYCPQCRAVVMRLSAFNRITGALLIGGVVMVLGGLLLLALAAVTGTTALVMGAGFTVTASVSGALWTYRAVRVHRTVAQPVKDYARGLVRP